MMERLLPFSEWSERRRAHEERVAPWIAPRLARKSAGERHPVDDFLFEYYSYRPAQLRRWHPGLGVTLEDADEGEWLSRPFYRKTNAGLAASPAALKPARFAFVRWLLGLLEAVRDRPPFFGCAGLHEWAMVYRAAEVRHSRWPLRLGAAGTAAVVETLPVRCGHFDAFRFFSSAARPLNRIQPRRERAPEFEQGGCLHANMDLYKWAYKLAPFTPSELVADAFALAREIRVADMRASPYDFSALGLTPIPIETPDGRAAYEAGQRAFAHEASPIRERLISIARALLKSGGCEKARVQGTAAGVMAEFPDGSVIPNGESAFGPAVSSAAGRG